MCAIDPVDADLGLEPAARERALDDVLLVPILREMNDDALSVERRHGVALESDRHHRVDQSHRRRFTLLLVLRFVAGRCFGGALGCRRREDKEFSSFENGGRCRGPCGNRHGNHDRSGEHSAGDPYHWMPRPRASP
jgi:hypothetical protein